MRSGVSHKTEIFPREGREGTEVAWLLLGRGLCRAAGRVRGTVSSEFRGDLSPDAWWERYGRRGAQFGASLLHSKQACGAWTTLWQAVGRPQTCRGQGHWPS